MEKRNKKSGRKSKYPLSFIRQVIREMIIDNLSYKETAIRFNLTSHSMIWGWYKKYSSDIQISNTENKMEEQTPDTKNEVAALQKAIEDANLKIEGLETMIDVAEEELKIDIRKKCGSKQPNE